MNPWDPEHAQKPLAFFSVPIMMNLGFFPSASISKSLWPHCRLQSSPAIRNRPFKFRPSTQFCSHGAYSESYWSTPAMLCSPLCTLYRSPNVLHVLQQPCFCWRASGSLCTSPFSQTVYAVCHNQISQFPVFLSLENIFCRRCRHYQIKHRKQGLPWESCWTSQRIQDVGWESWSLRKFIVVCISANEQLRSLTNKVRSPGTLPDPISNHTS